MAQIMQISPREYKNRDAISSTIKYITRTREHETKADHLICWGDHSGYHHGKTPAQTIAEFEYLHYGIFHKTGSSLLHFSIKPYPTEFQQLGSDFNRLANYAVACCQYIYTLGYQCCFAIHCAPGVDVHIHLVMSSVSYQEEYKFSQYPTNVYNMIEKPLIDLFYRHLYSYSSFDDAIADHNMLNASF